MSRTKPVRIMSADLHCDIADQHLKPQDLDRLLELLWRNPGFPVEPTICCPISQKPKRKWVGVFGPNRGLIYYPDEGRWELPPIRKELAHE